MFDGCARETVEIRELAWDTDFFGVTCAKVILSGALSAKEWDELEKEFYRFQFVSIENRNSVSENAISIGSKTKASLIDVNIQFEKKIEGLCEMPSNVNAFRGMKRDERILDIAYFPFSKFIDDPELKKRKGETVYKQWIQNSFDNSDKYFAVAFDEIGLPQGFVLYSYDKNNCIIELIAVSSQIRNVGIGSDLFRAVEHEALLQNCDKIKVGTQLRNIQAINFYHKCGCKQVGCHQIFHLWNL